ncbi:hypothetical protein DPMN_126714 [Dreissena polymorpha]|uniref:Uncharacterized protein n=1 Tax=Dreissena polymorpha TaxID=45954 RepID=A0A9D4GXK4_DREPO|nr:hypothetical protein DPMN_126714 [Dreissena polymorpha]
MLLQICDILPRERPGVLACCNPIPPLVRQYLNEIHTIIMKAREAPLTKVHNFEKEWVYCFLHFCWSQDI